MEQPGGGSADLVGGQVVARFRDYAGMVDAWRKAKALAGLSNESCEDIIDLSKGHIDKVIGPSYSKNAGPFVFDALTELLAVEYEMRFDADALKRMRPRWDGRDTSQIRIDAHSISKALLKRAKPIFHKEKGAQLAEGRKNIAPELRSRIARRAANTRWRKARAPELLVAENYIKARRKRRKGSGGARGNRPKEEQDAKRRP